MEFFLAPGFLWGLAAASAPILIHLLARRRYQRVAWAAMEFLRRALKRTQRRMRLENLLLLLLRTAAILLLALALARPVLSRVPLLAQMGEGERVALLALDTSASMGAHGDGGTPFERARGLAREVLDGLRARDEVYLCLVSDRPEAAFDPTPEKGRAREELDHASPGDAGTRWAPALAHLTEVLNRPDVKGKAMKQVFCFTDLRRAGWADLPAGGGAGLAEAPTPGGIAAGTDVGGGLAALARAADEVVILDVGGGERENLGIVATALADRVVGADLPIRCTAEVRNFGTRDAVDVPVRCLVDDRPHAGTKTIPVIPVGESRTADFQLSFPAAGAHRVRVELNPDVFPADDRRDHAVYVRDRVRVLLVDGYPDAPERFEREAFILKLALNPADEPAGASVSLVQPVEWSYLQLGAARFPDYDCVVLANDGAGVLDPAVRKALADYVREGGALLFIPGTRVNPADYTRELFLDAPEPAPDGRGLLPLPLGPVATASGEGDGSELTLLPEDWQHPLFRTMDDPMWRKFVSSPAVRRHFTVPGALAPGARVLARLSDLAQTPAIVERRIGSGRVMIFTFGWSPTFGRLYASPGALPLLHETIYYLARDPAPDRNVPFGSPLRCTVDASAFAEDVVVVLPTGGRRRLEPPTLDGDRYLVRVPETRHVGFHEIELRPPGGEVRRELFAVAGDPTEGDLAPADAAAIVDRLPEELRKKVRIARGLRSDRPLASTTAREVARPLLFAVLFLLLAESWLARRLSRRGAE